MKIYYAGKQVLSYG